MDGEKEETVKVKHDGGEASDASISDVFPLSLSSNTHPTPYRPRHLLPSTRALKKKWRKKKKKKKEGEKERKGKLAEREMGSRPRNSDERTSSATESTTDPVRGRYLKILVKEPRERETLREEGEGPLSNPTDLGTPRSTSFECLRADPPFRRARQRSSFGRR